MICEKILNGAGLSHVVPSDNMAMAIASAVARCCAVGAVVCAGIGRRWRGHSDLSGIGIDARPGSRGAVALGRCRTILRLNIPAGGVERSVEGLCECRTGQYEERKGRSDLC